MNHDSTIPDVMVKPISLSSLIYLQFWNHIVAKHKETKWIAYLIGFEG